MSTSQRESYHHGNLRPALLAQARALLDEGGPEALSLREAARRAGVSATATYRHFQDKEALLAAVAAEGFREFAAALTTPLRAGQPFAAMGRAYVEFALAHPGLFRLIFSPLMRERERYPELKIASNLAFDALRGATALAKGGSASDIESTAIAAWSMVHGLAHLLLDGVLPMERASQCLEAILQTPPLPR